jgi:signal transduction histidine kinase
LPHIFDEFYQIARQKGMPQDGNGLSMARAKKSIELLGDIIYVESEAGRGATFPVRLGDFQSPL